MDIWLARTAKCLRFLGTYDCNNKKGLNKTLRDVKHRIKTFRSVLIEAENILS